MKLAAVVVFYNPSDDNIKNIDKYKFEVDTIYVIDNTDDDIIRIKDDKKIKYIKLGENKGIAYALNKGAEYAIKDKYKWLLTMDQDTELDKNNLKKLKRYIETKDTKDVAIVSPYHLIKTVEEKSKLNIEEVDTVMTSANLLNLDIYSKLKGFKNELFIDMVDIEYCLNARSNNYKIIRLNNVEIKHNLGNQKVINIFNKKIIISNHNYIRRYYQVRNTLYVANLYKDKFNNYCNYLINVQKGQLKRIILFEHNKIKKIKYMKKGIDDYNKGIMGKINN